MPSPNKKFSPEKKAAMLERTEALLAEGKTLQEAAVATGASTKTLGLWRKEAGKAPIGRGNKQGRKQKLEKASKVKPVKTASASKPIKTAPAPRAVHF